MTDSSLVGYEDLIPGGTEDVSGYEDLIPSGVTSSEPPVESSTLGALGRNAVRSVVPAGGAAVGAMYGGSLGTAVGGPVGGLIGMGVGAIGGGLLTKKAQDIAVETADPTGEPARIAQEQADQEQHPFASAGGRLLGQIPTFEVAPLSILKGLPSVAKMARGLATTEAEQAAALGVASNVGAQAGLTVLPPLVQEGRLPTLGEGAEAAAGALLLGGPRFKGLHPTQVPVSEQRPPVEPSSPPPVEPMVPKEAVPSTGTIGSETPPAAVGTQDQSTVRKDAEYLQGLADLGMASTDDLARLEALNKEPITTGEPPNATIPVTSAGEVGLRNEAAVRQEVGINDRPEIPPNAGEAVETPTSVPKGEEVATALPPQVEPVSNPNKFPPAEPVVAPEAKPVVDKAQAAIDWLESKKIDTQGKLFDALQGIPVSVYNGVINTAIAGIKAGRAVHDVVLKAAKYLKEQYPHLNEKAVYDHILNGVPDFKGARESLPIAERVKRAGGMPPTPPSPSAIVTGLNKVAGVFKKITNNKFTPFRETLNDWIGTLQGSSIEVRSMMKGFEERVSDPRKREAITNWIQAAGDRKTLLERAALTSDKKLKQGYIDAANLTSDELKLASDVRDLFGKKLKELQDEGLLNEGLDNYVNQIWKRDPFASDASNTAQFATRLASNFKFGKKRTFPSFFDGEQAGFKPLTKDISKLVGLYVSEANKVLATRKLIADLTKKTASDGRPLAYPEGAGTVISPEEGGKGTILTFSNAKPSEFSDYSNKGISEPALSKWKWVTKDENGNPVMMKGNLAFHPEIYDHMKNVFGRSAIKDWYNSSGSPLGRLGKLSVKALDETNKYAKATMLSGFISPFHAVQEGTHAIGHKINPFAGIPVLDAKNPAQMRAMKHGLMLSGDRVSMEHFIEGMDTHNLMGKVPIAGEWSKQFSSWLFEHYIPGLKLKTYDAIRGRNLERFDKEIKSGTMTVDDVEYLSAKQANNAYGHLNYADMGSNPTMQHILRLGTLAPDFLNARLRFTGQAAEGLASKTGREQLQAMALLAGTFWVGARILNKLGDDDYHFDHPFTVIHKNREYTMRSVPEDIFRAFKDTRKFASGRVSPLFNAAVLEGLYGLNYRGEKVSKSEALGDALMNVVPLTLRQLPGVRQLIEHVSTTQKNRTVSPWEQFLGAAGLQVSRYSPITETYKNAVKWKADNGVAEDKGTYPVSKYQQLRYALEDGNFDKAKDEVDKLKASGLTPAKIASGFVMSVNHPFTGSKSNDEKMRTSLSGEAKILFDEAVDRRKVIIDRFRHVGK